MADKPSDLVEGAAAAADIFISSKFLARFNSLRR